MFRYLLIFLFHIAFRKFFKFDLRPKLIKYFHSFKFDASALLHEGIIPNDSFDYFNRNFFKNDIYGDDKRALWENHRLDIINRNELSLETRLGILLLWIDYSKKFDPIIFENMMEASLRSANILIFLEKNKENLSKKDTQLFENILRNVFLLNFIAPDMYVKRENFKIRDESNNHFIFCLCFQLLYMNYKKTLSSNVVRKFMIYFEKRFSNDGFLKEGSTFYSYSLSNAILKVLFFLGYRDIKEFKKIYKSFCISLNQDINLKDLNFGDRDGTMLLPSIDSDLPFKEFIQKQEFTKSFPDENIRLIENGDLKIIVNHRKIYDFGTLGHYHDDFGHFNLYSKNQIIFDPGTLSYSAEETRFDSSSYHNSVTISNSSSMIHKQKFEKTFNSIIKTEISDNTLSLYNSNIYGKWKREFQLNSLIIVDQFRFSIDPLINIIFKKKPKVSQQNDKGIVILVENVKIEISCNELFNYNIQPTVIAKDYSKSIGAYLLEMSFKKSLENRLKWEVIC
tara:strand:- start:15952 stop:17478 length:1527 start_codon:yes stop_codon:yes gene_type:complete